MVNVRTFSKDEGLVKSRRGEITKSAAQIFARSGYLKTTIREIADACGISIGTLYHYIGSKEDILHLLSEQAFAWVSEFVEETLNASMTRSPERSLELAIEKYIEWVDDIQDVVVFWYQETRNLPKASRSLIFEMEEKLVDMFSTLLADGCRKGRFKIDNCTLVAHNIVVFSDMWAFRRWSIRKTFCLKKYIKYQTYLITKSITKD